MGMNNITCGNAELQWLILLSYATYMVQLGCHTNNIYSCPTNFDLYILYILETVTAVSLNITAILLDCMSR